MFLPQEFEQRRQSVCRALAENGCAALLCLQPESLLWLAGVEPGDDGASAGLLVEADGRAMLLAGTEGVPRANPPVEEWRPWSSDPDCATQLAAVIRERGLHGAPIAVDGHPACGGGGAYRLAALPKAAALWEDATGLVERCRAVKSPREMAFIRRAAGLADDAFDAARARARSGAWEGELLGAMQAAMLQGGGDASAHGIRAGGGWPAHAVGPRRHLSAPDWLALQWAGAYRRYHAAMARTLQVGDVARAERDLHVAAAEATAAAQDACVPGATCGDVFEAYAGAVDRRGLGRARHCGYDVGLRISPTAVPQVVLERGNQVELVPGMALLLRGDVASADGGAYVTVGQTVELTEAGAVSLHRHGVEVPR